MIDIGVVKEHCKLDSDADETLLKIYMRAAWRYVENYTRRTMFEDAVDPDFGEESLFLDDDVLTAMLLCIGHWYENREATSTVEASEVPFAVTSLLQPYRIYGV